MNVIGFHNPDEENAFLSNWYPSDFTVDGISFSSMEQFMMYRKAVYFKDSDTAAGILATDDSSRMKELGRLVRGYNDYDWNGVRQIVVYQGLLEKFRQNSDLKKQLVETGDALLAECAVKDKIWGIGLSMTDPDRFDKEKWKGQNLMGYTLMMVRDNLK